MKCSINNDLHNVSIEPNGAFRLCLRVKGVATTKITEVDDIITKDGEFTPELIEAIQYDYKKYCRGCNWTCVQMTQFFQDQIIDHG